MTITREDFKAMAYMYEQVWCKICDYGDYINPERMDEVAYPMFDYIEKELRIDANSIGESLFYSAMIDREGIAVSWEKLDNGDIEVIRVSKDLDEIYDVYILNRAELDKLFN